LQGHSEFIVCQKSYDRISYIACSIHITGNNIENLYSRACQWPKRRQKFPVSTEFWIYFQILKS